MALSVLDVFVLSMLDRGCQTPYDLHRDGNLSLGAISPSLSRLLKEKLVTRVEGQSATKRPRHNYKATAAGRRLARTGWQTYLDSGRGPTDLDALLRIVDLALHYKAARTQIVRLLKNAGIQRHRQAQKLSIEALDPGAVYVRLRVRCDADRLWAEGTALLTVAKELGSKLPRSPSTLGDPTLSEYLKVSQKVE